MNSFASGRNHEITRVKDVQGRKREVCKCQIKDEHFHVGNVGRVEFPVYECPWLTRKYGFGTEEGI